MSFFDNFSCNNSAIKKPSSFNFFATSNAKSVLPSTFIFLYAKSDLFKRDVLVYLLLNLEKSDLGKSEKATVFIIASIASFLGFTKSMSCQTEVVILTDLGYSRIPLPLGCISA